MKKVTIYEVLANEEARRMLEEIERLTNNKDKDLQNGRKYLIEKLHKDFGYLYED